MQGLKPEDNPTDQDANLLSSSSNGSSEEPQIAAHEEAISRASLSNRQILKEVLTLSIPYSINGLMINGSFFINTLIFAQLGETALAASSLMTSTQLLTVASSKAMLDSTSVITARASHTESSMGAILQQSWVQSLVLTVPVCILYFSSKPLFMAIGQNEEIATIASDYLISFSLAVPAILLLKSSELFVMAAKYPKLVLLVNMSNTAATAGLNYMLTLGKLGAPKLGVRGAAYAAAMSTWACVLGLSLYLGVSKEFKKYNIYKLNHENRCKILQDLFRIGFPISIQVGVGFLYNFVKTAFVGMSGKNNLAADQIVAEYSSLILSPMLATSIVNGILVSRNIANERGANVKKIANTGIMISLAVPVIGSMLFFAIPKVLALPFLDENSDNYKEVMDTTKMLFTIYAFTNLVETVNENTSGVLRGFYDVVIPAMIAMSMLWAVGAPSSYLLAFTLNIGVPGILIGRGLGLLASTPLLLGRWFKTSKNPEIAIEKANTSLFSRFSNFFCRCSRQSNQYGQLSEEGVDAMEMGESQMP